MLKYQIMGDANGKTDANSLIHSDTINQVSLSAATPATDTIPAGAKFVLINSSTACYYRIGAAAVVPATITDGSASEPVLTSGSLRCIAPVATTGWITTGTNTLTVASTDGLAKGYTVVVKGAGVAGADLTQTISSISGLVVTLGGNASTTVSGAVVTQSITTIGLVAPATCIATLSYYK